MASQFTDSAYVGYHVVDKVIDGESSNFIVGDYLGVATFFHAGKGRRQNSSVAFGNFLQRMTNVGWQGFAAQLHPYHMLG